LTSLDTRLYFEAVPQKDLLLQLSLHYLIVLLVHLINPSFRFKDNEISIQNEKKLSTKYLFDEKLPYTRYNNNMINSSICCIFFLSFKSTFANGRFFSLFLAMLESNKLKQLSEIINNHIIKN